MAERDLSSEIAFVREHVTISLDPRAFFDLGRHEDPVMGLGRRLGTVEGSELFRPESATEDDTLAYDVWAWLVMYSVLSPQALNELELPASIVLDVYADHWRAPKGIASVASHEPQYLVWTQCRRDRHHRYLEELRRELERERIALQERLSG